MNRLRRDWVRRSVLIFIGVLLAFAYSSGYWQDLIVTPLVLGTLIGLLSESARSAYENSLIILVSQMVLVLILSFGGFSGAGAGANFAYTGVHRYTTLTILALSDYSMEFVAWILAVAFGSLLRRLFKRCA